MRNVIIGFLKFIKAQVLSSIGNTTNSNTPRAIASDELSCLNTSQSQTSNSATNIAHEKALTALELKEKAISQLKQTNAAFLIAKFYLAVRHYPAWSTRDDFDKEWSIGASGISSVNENLNGDECEFVLGEINGTQFKIGGRFHVETNYEDSGCTCYTFIKFGFGQDLKTVADLKYFCNDEPILPSDYSLADVFEYHYSERI